MEYTEQQLSLFDYIVSAGFDPRDVKRGWFEPDFVTFVVRGKEAGEEVTHKINLRIGSKTNGSF